MATFGKKFMNKMFTQISDCVNQNAFERFVEILNECKLRGIDLNSIRNGTGYNLLVQPCLKNKPLFLRELLDRGVNVNAVDAENSTALHAAVANGTVECVKILLEYWPDISIKDTYNERPYTAREYANGNSQYDIEMRKLLDEYEESAECLSVKEVVEE